MKFLQLCGQKSLNWASGGEKKGSFSFVYIRDLFDLFLCAFANGPWRYFFHEVAGSEEFASA